MKNICRKIDTYGNHFVDMLYYYEENFIEYSLFSTQGERNILINFKSNKEIEKAEQYEAQLTVSEEQKKVTYNSFREFRLATGISQIEFCRHYGISRPVVQAWEYDRSKCKPYLLNLFIDDFNSDDFYEQNHDERYSTIKEVRLATGLTQTEFGNILDIPSRTLQGWELGEAKCTDYLFKLIVRYLKRRGYIK